MNVVTTLKMDLAQPERTQQVFCVQGDTFSRTVILELVADGKVWTIPEETSVLISYYKPDGTCGTYTQLPDGTQAWDISENLITLALTPHMLTAAGLVSAQLKLVCGEETISTFTFQVVVRPGIAPGDDPENYRAWLTAYLPQTMDAEIGQYLEVSQVDSDGRVTGLIGTKIILPPDHTNRVLALEERAFNLENTTAAIPQFGNRITALERSTGEIPTLKNRILNLETVCEAVPQLGSRVQELEGTAAITMLLEERVEDLEAGAKELDQLNIRVTALENGSTSYPAEWERGLEDCIAAVRQHQTYGGIASVSFAYFSDHHNNGGCAGTLIARVMEECNMPFSFFCGDMVSQEPKDDIGSVATEIRSFNKMMSPVPTEKDFRTLGEHDLCRIDSNGRLWCMEANELYEYFFRKQYSRNQCVISDDTTYFYVNDNIHRIRFIVLNSLYFTPKYNSDSSISNGGNYGFGQDQLDWLINNALYFEEEGWGVIFIAHSPLSNQGDSNLRDAHILRGILSAYLERGFYEDHILGQESVHVEVDFQDAITADIIGWFSGHTHTDSITTLEMAADPELYSLPLNVVTIASDGNSGHAIDFVTVDKDMRTVFLTRLGSGENRSFTY